MPELTGFQRFLLAFIALFKVWFDRDFALGVWGVQNGRALPPSPEAAPSTPPPARQQTVEVPPPPPATATGSEALQLLALLQRDGRFVDFLQEDLSGASDEDLAAVVRATLYEGCKKTLAAHLKLGPVLDKPEGAMVTVEAGFDPSAIRLTGNVVGSPPFRGTLKHRGWKATEVKLPALPRGEAASVVAPAEVELP
jgi:hypothetical protein